METPLPASTRRRSVPKRTRIAHHEAGHAVLSAAINDAPSLVSIRSSGMALGRSRYRMEAGPAFLAQVHLAGFAAEELLMGRRSRQLSGPELGFSIASLTDPALADIGSSVEGCDQYLAVQVVLAMGCPPTGEAVRADIERFYGIAKASLASVWPAVLAVAQALLRQSELDSDGFFAAIAGHQIYTPVFAVQDDHGLR
jgi:hypothetical protein